MKMILNKNRPSFSPVAVSVSKKWDTRSYFGRSTFGLSHFQQNDAYAGIYQQRKCREGKLTILMKFYKPTNPNTLPQQTVRSNFANAILNWQSLTPAEKEIYNESAKGQPFSGYNLFIRQYLNS